MSVLQIVQAGISLFIIWIWVVIIYFCFKDRKYDYGAAGMTDEQLCSHFINCNSLLFLPIGRCPICREYIKRKGNENNT